MLKKEIKKGKITLQIKNLQIESREYFKIINDSEGEKSFYEEEELKSLFEILKEYFKEKND